MTQAEKFSIQSGIAGHPPTRWQPSAHGLTSAGLSLDRTRPTLIMLVHPRCPCTRASLAELNRLAALCPDRAALFVLFWQPPGCSAAWARTDLFREAQAILGVRVRLDRDGTAGRCFGAVTSGETLLYAPDGRLLFHGGLTGARGHEGDNAGLSAVAALLSGASDTQRRTPVYGCPLTGCSKRVEVQR